MKTLVVLILTGIFVGCASKSEIKSRQDNAFDLSGEYTSSATDSGIPVYLKIENESGKHDVKIKLDRSYTLVQSEIEFANKTTISESEMVDFIKNNQWLGEGSHFDLDGGENISDNSGQSSRLFVCSRWRNLSTVSADTNRRLQKCFSGKISRTDYVLRGKFQYFLNTETKTQGSGESKVISQTEMGEGLNFVGQTDRMYFEQYFIRNWHGELSFTNGYKHTKKSLIGAIRRDSINSQIWFQPLDTQIEFEGRVYNFQPTTITFDEIKNDQPVIHWVYANAASQTKIIFSGAIFSVGNFSGGVMLLAPAGEKSVGHFILKTN